MKLRSKILVLALSLCLCLSGLFGFVTEVNAEEYIDESVELLHELSHQLGAHDHYCYTSDDDDNDDETPCTNPWCEKHTYDRAPICTTVMGEANYNLFASTSKSAWYCPMNLKEINDHLTAQCQ
jgi:hypothetical protein